MLNVFDKVDIVEQNSAFVEEAKRSLGHKAEQFFATGLQDFTPEQGRYDVVWIQWVLGHLTDGTDRRFCAKPHALTQI